MILGGADGWRLSDRVRSFCVGHVSFYVLDAKVGGFACLFTMLLGVCIVFVLKILVSLFCYACVCLFILL